MKILGTILILMGAIGLVTAGINYANQTDKFNLLGISITISQGSLMPIIIAGMVFILGIIVIIPKKK
jgi:hypothetical protein